MGKKGQGVEMTITSLQLFFFGNSDVLQIGVDRVVCNSIIKPHWLLS